MNIFTSRSVFQTENSSSNIIRKQDVSNAGVVRKPFADRLVNCHSPNLTTARKLACQENDAAEVLSNCSDLDNEDFCSDIKIDDEDHYEDILPLSKRLEDVHVHQICAKFLTGDQDDTDFVGRDGFYDYQHSYPLGRIATKILFHAKKLARFTGDEHKKKKRRGRRLPQSYHELRERPPMFVGPGPDPTPQEPADTKPPTSNIESEEVKIDPKDH